MEIKKTVLYESHIAYDAKMVDFAGYMMPLQYSKGIVAEHLATRKEAGIFDVSHMGRFKFTGRDSLPFLQHTLTNNAAALEVGTSQYTIISDENGFAVDDSYLYRFYDDEYLLVVNAANKEKDWDYFQSHLNKFNDVQISDITDDLAMISLQGPLSKKILNNLITDGSLPEPMRNELSIAQVHGREILIARTGYTGEPICFELFIKVADAEGIWQMLLENGANPVGLGARDTLRLEAALPLYGHEFGLDIEGKSIPIFACPLARFAVSFSELKGDFIGKQVLLKQFADIKNIRGGKFDGICNLPRIIMPIALLGRGIARDGNKVFFDDKHVGYVTSGTMVPYWKVDGHGLGSELTNSQQMRSIGLALIDCEIQKDQQIQIESRNRKIDAVVVPYHLRVEAPPYARAILYKQEANIEKTKAVGVSDKVQALLKRSISNTTWRQKECINLIPSEQTTSLMSRLLSVMDPSGRYAEHKKMKAFDDLDILFYQGTDFILEVEQLLDEQLMEYFGCTNIESRLISGQMANTAIFSSMVDYLNRLDRKIEPKRMPCVMNNHIIKGGHLSSQPMGALKDFVARNTESEKPSIINFPVEKDNPYKIDINACQPLIADNKPALIVLGKSAVLHPEPVSQIRAFINEYSPESFLMYDMAHVLGLVGPYFQEPFKEGADIVTGSTHKTYFGTQRGIVAGNFDKQNSRYEFWESLERRVFPGSVSNHHLGTLLGLLMASYEMNHFKDEYQKNVINNAKVFAKALSESGLNVAGDPDVSFTETHQVIINVGFGMGPEIAARLERSNVIVNFQAAPDEEGFTASGAVRMGVSEMTRFGMKEADFKKLAAIIYDIIVNNKNLRDEIETFRSNFTQMEYCFSEKDFEPYIQKIHKLL